MTIASTLARDYPHFAADPWDVENRAVEAAVVGKCLPMHSLSATSQVDSCSKSGCCATTLLSRSTRRNYGDESNRPHSFFVPGAPGTGRVRAGGRSPRDHGSVVRSETHGNCFLIARVSRVPALSTFCRPLFYLPYAATVGRCRAPGYCHGRRHGVRGLLADRKATARTAIVSTAAGQAASRLLRPALVPRPR